MISFSQQKKIKASDVNLTPMIDIIFNLLIFFLIVAVISQKGLNLTLPETSTAEKRPEKNLEITVTADKEIIFDGQKISINEIEKYLQKEIVKQKEQRAQSIILKSDVDAPFGIFVTIMDTARKVGLTNLVIATKHKFENEGGSN